MTTGKQGNVIDNQKLRCTYCVRASMKACENTVRMIFHKAGNQNCFIFFKFRNSVGTGRDLFLRKENHAVFNHSPNPVIAAFNSLIRLPQMRDNKNICKGTSNEMPASKKYLLVVK